MPRLDLKAIQLAEMLFRAEQPIPRSMLAAAAIKDGSLGKTS